MSVKTTPAPYSVGFQPSLPGSDPLYLQNELRRIADTLNLTVSLTPQAATVAPKTPVDGMQRLARSPWRPAPGQTTDEWVQFNGTSWDRLVVPSSYRNLLHNPLFNVQQRGAGPWTAAATTADRWSLQFATTGGSVSAQVGSMTAVTAGSFGDEYAKYNYQITTTSGSGAADLTALQQNVEDVRRLSGKTVTVSFWAWCVAGTPKVGVELAQAFGTGGSPLLSVPGGAVTISTTPTRYSVTITLPSVAPKTLGTAGTDYTALTLWLSSGATNATRASNIGAQSGTFLFWGVQLEIGSVATPLERPDPADDLARCQRFYHVGQIVIMSYGTAGIGVGHGVPSPVSMRAAPTVVVTGNFCVNMTTPTVVSLDGNYGLYTSGIVTATGSYSLNFQYTASADL